VLIGEAAYTNCIVFGLILLAIERTVDRTRDKHANYEITCFSVKHVAFTCTSKY